MPGRIPQQFIDDLISRVDVVEVIESRMELKRAGREYKACCPFHNEDTPSFTVVPNKQFYHCFGCGAHGSAIGFLMEYDGLSYPDAIEELASIAGVRVPRETIQRDEGLDDLYAMLDACSRLFEKALRGSDKAIEYLRNRGIDGEIAKKYQLGWAPDSWDTLVTKLGTNRQRLQLLNKAGMLSERDSGGFYDKFRARVMFPIHDGRGRTIAFGGRILDDNGPKYLNSPETNLFHKGRQLYGLVQARKKGHRLESIIVVEGYMDVVALAQHGISNVVATLGTATTGDHAQLLFRTAPEVIFCFDGDRAGRQAAWRAVESTLPALREGRQARFLFLPDGEDPDSLVRKEGAEVFGERIQSATPLSEFFFAHFQSQVDMTSLDGRSRMVELAKPLLQTIPEGAFRVLMFERLEELARARSNLDSGTGSRPQPARPDKVPTADPKRTIVRSMIALLLQRPSLAQLVEKPEIIKDLGMRGSDLLLEIIEIAQANPQIKAAALIDRFMGRPERRHLAVLASRPLLADNHNLEAEFQDAWKSVIQKLNEQRLNELVDKQKRSGTLSPQEKAELLQRLQARTQPRR